VQEDEVGEGGEDGAGSARGGRGGAGREEEVVVVVVGVAKVRAARVVRRGRISGGDVVVIVVGRGDEVVERLALLGLLLLGLDEPARDRPTAFRRIGISCCRRA